MAMKHKLFGLIGMLILAVLSMGSVAGATGYPELVVNGGFETGNLAGWTQSGDMRYNDVIVFQPHSGSYELNAGSWNFGYISQTIALDPGALYTISFSLGNLNWGGDPAGEFTASFGGTTLLVLTNQADFDYRNYSFTLLGVGSSADLTFGFWNFPGGWLLDDVSVVDPPAAVPEPSMLLLLGCGLAGLAIWRRKQTATA